MRRLVEEFGEKRAAEILGNTAPPARRKQQPTSVGVKPKARGIGWADQKGTGGGPAADWKNRPRREDEKPRVRLLRVTIKQGRRCADCRVLVPKDDDIMRLTWFSRQAWYCPPCGAKEVKRNG